jgi:hypothetical protein
MKDIPGYEHRYAITKDGLVWSYPKLWIGSNGAALGHEGKFLKAFGIGTIGYQYLAVQLGKKLRRVHRLVAEAYVPNPENLPFVNHKDGNRFNNASSNLEWTTQEGNSLHAENMGLMKRFYGEDHGRHKLSTKEVEDIRKEREAGATLKQLSEYYNSSISNISYICRKETRIYG